MPKPPELKVLERWVGNRTVDVTGKPSVWEPEGSKWEGSSKGTLVLDGRFLYTTVKAKGKLGKYEFIALRTYDQNKKVFPSWSYFITNKASGINETIGRWDEDAKTMTDSGEDADRGTTANSKMTFIDKDRLDFSFVVKDKEGKFLLNRHGTTRKSKVADDESKEDKAPKAQPRSPELKVLAGYLGNWDAETIIKVAQGKPKETRITGTFTNEWVLDGTVMQIKGKSSTGVESIQMRTYDPQRMQYRAWVFDSTGTAASSIGTWDEDAKTMNWKGDFGNGVTATNTVRFVGSDTIEWRLVARSDAGKVFMDMEGSFKRKK
jgi:hypothetical protein